MSQRLLTLATGSSSNNNNNNAMAAINSTVTTVLPSSSTMVIGSGYALPHSFWSEDPGTGKRTKISHGGSPSLSAWDIDGGLAADFDGSLSGLGTELGTASYNMNEALLALPVFKQENMENGFQYVLGAATSPAVKMNEETLTYLNQGQSYEIKVKKLGDLSEYQGKCIRSVLKILFHDRRLQYMEKEQYEIWKHMRPGERILDIDIPLSYGLIDVRVDQVTVNCAEFIWDPTKESGVYIRVHCISTEFTPKKHGGEKGVPFRIQIESYNHGDESKLLHCGSCQIKVFKPKGADRKHKTDREKMDRRSEAEKEKYQPSYECTVLTEMPLDQVIEGPQPQSPTQLAAVPSTSPTIAPQAPPAQQQLFTTISKPSSYNTISNSSTCSDSGSPSPISPQSPSISRVRVVHSPLPVAPAPEKQSGALPALATATEVTNWMNHNRFSNFVRVFQNFSGADILRLTRDDLIQICGLADGIRLNNALQARSVRPRLTLYVCQDPEPVYHALYLEHLTSVEILTKLAILFSLKVQQIIDVYIQGPSGIHILVTDEVIHNLREHARFTVEGIKAEGSGNTYRLLLKTSDETTGFF